MLSSLILIPLFSILFILKLKNYSDKKSFNSIVSYIKFIFISILTLFLISFGLRLYLPLVVAAIHCAIVYLKQEHTGSKKTLFEYICLYTMIVSLLYVIYFIYPYIFEILNIYVEHSNLNKLWMILTGYMPESIINCKPIVKCSLLPPIANQPYDGRNVADGISINNIDTSTWSTDDKLILTNRLINQFNAYSLELRKGEVAYCRDILLRKNVQENWVVFPASSSIRIRMFAALSNPEYQEMILAEKDELTKKNSR